MQLSTYLKVMLNKNEQHFGADYAMKLNEELELIIAKLEAQGISLLKKGAIS